MTDAFLSSQKFVVFDEEKSGALKSEKIRKNPKKFMQTKKITKNAILEHPSKGNKFSGFYPE